MTTKLYKKTWKGRQALSEVHEAIGQRGGLIMRVDQTDTSTTAYFEAGESAKGDSKDIEAASLEEVTKV